MLLVKTYKVGGLATNCYLLQDSDTKKMAIIDPGGISKDLDKEILNLGADNFLYIILTHGHFDHIRKVKRYKDLTNAKVVMSEKEIDFISDSSLNLSSDFKSRDIETFSVDHSLSDEEELDLGNTKIKIIYTPGHTKGGACYIADDCLFTGDTLMKNDIGRTDLKSGNMKDMMNSLKKINTLHENYIIYPGHGDISNLAFEKENNPYLRKVLDDIIY